MQSLKKREDEKIRGLSTSSISVEMNIKINLKTADRKIINKEKE